MKRRWTILFYCSLASLVGISWVARSFNLPLGSLLNFALVGMIAATAMAFFAMIRNIHDKWPAAVVLICAGPMVLDAMQVLGDLLFIIRAFGGSVVLVVVGAVATAATSTWILMAQPPRPAPEPQVAPARVVD